jgi:hypothetical protein
MRKVAINILSAAKVYAPKKIENLDEKRIVPKMMVRRRLTRNAKIMLYLADKCGFENGKIVYGSAFGELQPTAEITTSILNKLPISPTSFQNSVYNTAPSYFSLLKKDTDEIITVSSGMKTSKDALKTAALQALVSKEKVLCVVTECIDIPKIEEVKECTEFLESGAAVVVEIAKDSNGAVPINSVTNKGIIPSVKDLMDVVSMFENGSKKILINL